VDDEEHEELKKRLDWEVTRIQVRSVAAHLPTGWSGGTAVALARVSWNPWTGEVPQSSNDCAYRVVGNAAGDGAISVNQQDADIDVAGNWTDLASDGTSSFIPDGFVFAKEGDNRVGFDWSLGIPGNATLYRRYYVCVLIPTFSKGLDEATARNSLDKLRGITPPPAADGRALPRPLPGMIFGINLGPGLDDGTSSAWLAVVPSMSPCWYSYEAFIPFGYEIGQIPFSWQGWRFDCVPALRFIGAETDYQVVYGTSRDPSVRNWDLPSCGTGNDIFLASGWCYQNRFLEAWDAPSIRQVVGKHLVADVTVTGGFSQVVKIYRRNGDTFTRTPGVAVDPSGLTLLRTLTIGNPSGLTGLGSGAEHLKISDDTGTGSSSSQNIRTA
jgi:hypothetical protein